MDSRPVNLRQRRSWVAPVLIIGAGPAGLATAACLTAKSIPYLVLEREDCSGSLWKYKTYERLHLHLPKQYCQLPLFPFPASYPTYPSCEQFIVYLENYREHFGIHPVYNTKVTLVEYFSAVGYWIVTAEEKPSYNEHVKIVRYLARSVVIATGENGDPYMPSFSGEEKFTGEISHSMTYRSGEKYEGKKVLVVGVGNTGMELALDLANFGAMPTLVARSKIHIMPRDLLGVFSTFDASLKLLKIFPMWFADKILVFLSWLTLGCTDKYNLIRPAEGPLQMKKMTGHTPVLDVGTVAKIRSGHIKVVPAIDQLTEDGATFENGVEEKFDAIIMATGYKCSVTSEWFKEGEPFEKEEIFNAEWKGRYGLYPVGMSKQGLMGCARDAVHVANCIADLEANRRINPT
ncbi:hypothetical protein KC19_1G223400 [Ceratodon purpureus]|uniref:Flavin-containing monooxygenase n=1 Tax=Ceratodon purpureus TaxID=3225 RepID=A0A8T0JAU5_CERPU|nr:hypothetical protein KC19_1G223400 [Ceratodon purpureus]